MREVEMVRVIKTAEDLKTLLSRRARRGIDHVTLELAFNPESKRRLEATINASLRSCGCETGAVFVAVAVAAGLAAVLLDPTRIRWLAFGEVWRLTVVLLALGLVGKILGLIIAEARLRNAVREVAYCWGRPSSSFNRDDQSPGIAHQASGVHGPENGWRTP